MVKLTDPQRREFLRSALATATLAATASGLSVSACMPSDSAFVPDLHIELRSTKDEAQIRPGQPTHVWRYHGKVIKGDLRVLEFLDYLPLLRMRWGQKVRIDLINDLSEPTIVHWHGLYVPAAMDGHPRHAIGRGKRYVYEFEVRNRAGTYWFHPHPHGRTGKQVYFGMAGLLIVSDDEESAAGLPDGDYDIPLIIQDRRFDNDNQLIYLSGSDSNGMMGEGMMGGGRNDGPRQDGRYGADDGRYDGVSRGSRSCQRQTRFRTAGGGAGVPPAPAQRFEHPHLQARLERRLAGDRRCHRRRIAGETAGTPLCHAVAGGEARCMGGFQQPTDRSRTHAAEPFLRRRYGDGRDDGRRHDAEHDGEHDGRSAKWRTFPDPKSPHRAPIHCERGIATSAIDDSCGARPQDTVNFRAPKVFNITMGMMVWGINGRSFEMEGVTADETVRLDTAESWEFHNDADTGMIGTMAHAMHVHGLQFRVLQRSVEPRFSSGRNSVSAGYVDVGWKDTVLVMPGERVRMLLRFEHYDGLYLYHCHMLEHEDSGLMRNYLVEA